MSEDDTKKLSVASKFILKAQKLQEPVIINYVVDCQPVGGVIEEFDEESIVVRLQEEGIKGKTFHLLIKRNAIITLMFSEDEWKEH